MFEKNLLCNLYYLSLIMRMQFIRIQPKLFFCFLLQLIISCADLLLDVLMIHITDLLKWFPLNIRRHIHWLQFIFKCIHFNYPNYLRQNLILYSSPYHLRHSAYYVFTPLVRKVFGKKAFRYKAPADWNNLPSKVCSLTYFYRFKKGLFSCFEISCNCFG